MSFDERMMGYRSIVVTAMVMLLASWQVFGAHHRVSSERLDWSFRRTQTFVESQAMTGWVWGYEAEAIGNVTVKILGPVNFEVVSDLGGYFRVPALPLGQYTVTPSAPSFTFSPASQIVTYDGEPLQLEFKESGGFIGSPFEVSGRLTTPYGTGLRNATVTLINSDGVTRTVPSSSMGYYRISGFNADGHHVIRVTSRRYRFESTEVILGEKYLTTVDIVGLE